MGILLRTHKRLWAKSGNRCAFESCRNELVFEDDETFDSSVIGEEAHIVATKK
ncbi:MAG: hypothetical protein ACI84C_000396 [Flavobacteriales bacterium]|jgi:hypothetical protein